MKKRHCFLRVMVMCTCVFTVFFFPINSVADAGEKWIARIESVQGNVYVNISGTNQWRPVHMGDTCCVGDAIRVGSRSRATVYLRDRGMERLDEESTMLIEGVDENKNIILKLLEGVAYFFSQERWSLKVNTPYLDGNVKGTEFLVKVDSEQTLISVFEGRVLASNRHGSISLVDGQSAVAGKEEAPTLKTIVNPRDAVNWALYYAPVVEYGVADYSEGAESPAYFIEHAGRLLAVGRVKQAEANIKRALNLDPDYSNAFALQSIICVVQNNKDKALRLAEKSVKADSDNPAAYIALSYTRQARFDLEGALDALHQAVKIDPDNALAWARLSELQLSLGHLDSALASAKKATELNPDLARIQTVLGFAYLSQIETAQAKEAFKKATELDQAAPLPRLGLGLSTIREGDLKEGRVQIEAAASLDPNNAIIRSYLGKAYFEEKRNTHALRQLSTAKELDPLDPTPWFYGAILNQTVNRPVEALHDLQKSILLNDNRVVYRSRLLLDEDLAARSASLARIYRDLGFEQLALTEGWRSLNSDPTNFSAHRFLADSYAVLPRHEIAKASELLQSQLLQPLNITPVPPHLAESHLFILEGAGPITPSFNEYTHLFHRNRLALQAGGIYGENSTRGYEAVHSAVFGKFSYSVGQFYYETDGFRWNNDLEVDIFNLFAQTNLNHKTSVQVEYRNKDTKNGDLAQRFFKDNFLPNLNETGKTESARIGLHYSGSPGSDIIASLIYQDLETSLYDRFGIEFELEKDEYAYITELQYLFRSEHLNLVAGGGYLDRNSTDLITITPSPFPPAKDDTDIEHSNAYLYSYTNCLPNVTFTLGCSGDFFDGGLKDRDQVNPKIGVTWSPFPNTVLRGAAFKVLKRSLISNQTLEPTQVAGFNQFFDDPDSTKSWLYGVGVDQKLSKNLYVGAEYSVRELTLPFEDIPLPPEPPMITIREVDWEERLSRAYIYWTPHPWVSTAAAFHYEQFDRDDRFTAGIEEVDTCRLPLGINVFHPCGFIARFEAAYTDQDGNFLPQGSMPGMFVAGDDQFWVMDASLGYRLPRRLGLISIEGKNIFDESFKYYDTDPMKPIVQPDRLILLKASLVF
ncbi:MAG: tetratricopeptide repeat protein [Desulfobacterales bacterium]